MATIHFQTVAFGSPEYREAVKLREDILRRPFGKTFTDAELQEDDGCVQVVGYLDGKICATAMLIHEGELCRMRRVAVRADLQGSGAGSAMMRFCDDYARQHGFREIYCHARETAVSFYRKNGYVAEGEPFEEIGIPHLFMRRAIT